MPASRIPVLVASRTCTHARDERYGTREAIDATNVHHARWSRPAPAPTHSPPAPALTPPQPTRIGPAQVGLQREPASGSRLGLTVAAQGGLQREPASGSRLGLTVAAQGGLQREPPHTGITRAPSPKLFQPLGVSALVGLQQHADSRADRMMRARSFRGSERDVSWHCQQNALGAESGVAGGRPQHWRLRHCQHFHGETTEVLAHNRHARPSPSPCLTLDPTPPAVLVTGVCHEDIKRGCGPSSMT